jgi:Exostosin family
MRSLLDCRTFLLLIATFLVLRNLAQSKCIQQIFPVAVEIPVQENAENETPVVPKYRLNVPFYIHTDYDLNWHNATAGGKPYWPAEPNAKTCDGKHSDDYWYMRSAWKHPMRTFNPNEAKLFFVPVLLNEVMERYAEFWKLRHKPFCAHGKTGCIEKDKDLELLYKVNDALGRNKYFQRSDGTDHIIVLSHWEARKLPANVTNIHKCNTLTFEDEVPNATLPYDRIRMPGFYVGKPCPLAEKTHDFAMIATFKHNKSDAFEFQKRNFQSRADLCEWLPGTAGTTIRCGPGEQCPALAQARYGFHVRGDTWGSNRLMDTLMSRTVPIFTSEEQYKILPSFYPWKEVGYLIEVSDRKTFQKEVEKLLNRPAKEYEEKLRKIDQYMYLLNHTLPYQFDGHMADLADKLELTVK